MQMTWNPESGNKFGQLTQLLIWVSSGRQRALQVGHSPVSLRWARGRHCDPYKSRRPSAELQAAHTTNYKKAVKAKGWSYRKTDTSPVYSAPKSELEQSN